MGEDAAGRRGADTTGDGRAFHELGFVAGVAGVAELCMIVDDPGGPRGRGRLGRGRVCCERGQARLYRAWGCGTQG